MSSPESSSGPRQRPWRTHILAALGIAGGATACTEIPTLGEPKLQGLYASMDKDADGVPAAEDCNDSNSAIRPGAEEICNQLDDNCDGQIDEDVRTVYFRDADGDTYGNPRITSESCEQPDGYVTNDEDCNDNSASALPGGEEVCDGLDNDCNGETDNIDGFWPDDDGDGYGREGTAATLCEPMPEGYADNRADCDDANADVNPGMVEQCMDGIDNDCDSELSCMVLEITETSGEVCQLVWEMSFMEAYMGTPCVDCNFSFTANLQVVERTGASPICEDLGDRWTDFQVEGVSFGALEAIYVGEDWMVDGTWDGGILSWYTANYLLNLDSTAAFVSYMGELNNLEVEEYYYYYDYYDYYDDYYY